MFKKAVVFSCSLLAMVFLMSGLLFAEDKYSDMKKYDGDPDAYNNFFKDPIVNKALTKLLGKETNKLHDDLAMGGPVETESGTSILVAKGFAPHSNGFEEGIFTFNMVDGSVTAAMLSKGKQIKVYTGKSQLPSSVENWINQLKNNNKKISIKYIK